MRRRRSEVGPARARGGYAAAPFEWCLRSLYKDTEAKDNRARGEDLTGCQITGPCAGVAGLEPRGDVLNSETASWENDKWSLGWKE